MTELERMAHLDDIEAVAKHIGLVTRRNDVRSLTCIQIKDTSGEWIMFDPISRGKDFARMMYAVSVKSKLRLSEVEFRKFIMEQLKNHDFTIS